MWRSLLIVKIVTGKVVQVPLAYSVSILACHYKEELTASLVYITVFVNWQTLIYIDGIRENYS